jgi:translocation and assembly module TamA
MRARVCLLAGLCALAASAVGEVEIALENGDRLLETNLRARLALAAEDCDAPAWRVRRLFARAEQDFDPALRALGYYRASIEKDLETDDDCWRATFTVDPGERTRVRSRSVKVDGDASDDPAMQALLAELPLAEGEPLNHADYEAIKNRLRTYALEYGYFDFVIQRQELRVFPAQSAAEIVIEASSGPRYRFGELQFNEQPIDETLLRRLGRLQPGADYESAKLIALDRQLSDTGYFQSVEVRARRQEAVDLQIPVDVRVEPAKRHAWRAGVGYSTDTGPRLSLQYSNRYLNARGHHFNSELRLSPGDSGLKADYLIPGRDPRRETFSFGAGLTHEETDSATSDSATAIARQILKSKHWTQTRFLELLYERSEVAGIDDTYTLLMPGIAFNRIDADDPLRTRRGYRVLLEARGAYEGVLSTTTMLQFRASGKWIHRLGDSGRISVRGDAGSTLVDSVLDLPATLRFFAGGDNSVRGYDYESLGPVDAQGAVQGGRHLLTSSLEYEHPVFRDEWWVAAFVDAGNAFDDADDIDVKVGYGVGVRWYSPVGRLRLDLAFPDDTSNDDWRLHFGLGADL